MLDAIRSRLSPTVPQLLDLFEEFKSEMRVGLEADGRSWMKMIPTFVNRVPTGSETGQYYALDLGGTNFRVLKVRLGEGKVTEEAVSRYTIPEALMRGSGEALFDFIADSLDDFLTHQDPSPPPAEVEKVLGFTFSSRAPDGTKCRRTHSLDERLYCRGRQGQGCRTAPAGSGCAAQDQDSSECACQ